MNHAATLIFPHQLFESHPALANNRSIYLIEHTRFFTDFAFHKQKLLLHRATLRMYYDFLIQQGYTVTYINYKQSPQLLDILYDNKITEIHLADVTDHLLMQQLNDASQKAGITIQVYETPQFLTKADWIEQEYQNNTSFLQHSFYIAQRKHFNILIQNKKPVGGKWTFDTQNRQKLNASLKLPSVNIPQTNKYLQEAETYITQHFAQNPGFMKPFAYPTTFTQARTQFIEFLETRFEYFGPYQDAMARNNHTLFHSLLSPLLNIGLLTPDYIINETLAYAQIHKIPLNSLEGFIRQIIGWREYVRAIYLLKGEIQRRSNYFQHTRILDESWWNATTGIEPLDTIITQVLKTGYTHHIERLMVLGNFMLLTEINPHEVYRWFMELFIDAYDWVMVPNVYGMSQYADGGIMSTKPYISSSKYIIGMSDYTVSDWTHIWDSLYWNFLAKHRDQLNQNSRMNLVLKSLSRLSSKTLIAHKRAAAEFLGHSNPIDQ